jgi:hypothetical protein
MYQLDFLFRKEVTHVSNCSQNNFEIKCVVQICSRRTLMKETTYATGLVNQVLLASTFSSGEGTPCILGTKPTTRTKCGNEPLILPDFLVGLFSCFERDMWKQQNSSLCW